MHDLNDNSESQKFALENGSFSLYLSVPPVYRVCVVKLYDDYSPVMMTIMILVKEKKWYLQSWEA